MIDTKTVLAKYEPGKGDGWRNKARWDEDDQAIYDALAASQARVEALEKDTSEYDALKASTAEVVRLQARVEALERACRLFVMAAELPGDDQEGGDAGDRYAEAKHLVALAQGEPQQGPDEA